MSNIHPEARQMGTDLVEDLRSLARRWQRRIADDISVALRVGHSDGFTHGTGTKRDGLGRDRVFSADGSCWQSFVLPFTEDTMKDQKFSLGGGAMITCMDLLAGSADDMDV